MLRQQLRQASLWSAFLLLYPHLFNFVAGQNPTLPDDFGGPSAGLWTLLDPPDRDPIDLALLTNNGTSVTIPDYTLTDLLFRFPNVTGDLPPWSGEAISLYNMTLPLSAKTKALYETDDLLPVPYLIPAPFQSPRKAADDSDSGTPPAPLLFTSKLTSLSGMIAFWGLAAQAVSMIHGCDCRGNAWQEPADSAWSFVNMQLILAVDPSPSDPPEKGWQPLHKHGNDCSPRYLAQGRIRPASISAPNQPSKLLAPYPVTQSIVQAHFDMVVDLLRNETAIHVLESMKIKRRAHDQVRVRIIKAAGLPASAIENMRGYLTIRQYALYQALHRGDNNCPIPTTECGKSGPNPCDQYPPKTAQAPV